MKHKHIAPRLLSGECRERVYNALPPNMKHAVRWLARKNNESINWTIEKALIRAFDLEEPEYVKSTRYAEVHSFVSGRRNYQAKKRA